MLSFSLMLKYMFTQAVAHFKVNTSSSARGGVWLDTSSRQRVLAAQNESSPISTKSQLSQTK